MDAISSVQGMSKALFAQISVIAGTRWDRLVLIQGHGVCDIARGLGRAASTNSCEIRRNAATRVGNLDFRDDGAVACRAEEAALQGRKYLYPTTGYDAE